MKAVRCCSVCLWLGGIEENERLYTRMTSWRRGLGGAMAVIISNEVALKLVEQLAAV